MFRRIACLVVTAFVCSVEAVAGDVFLSAGPMWAKGAENAQNVFLRFRASFAGKGGDVPILRIAASSVYRAKVNGCFVGSGPARTSRGFASVDEWPLASVTNGVNNLEIDVCSYNVPDSYQYLMEPGFLQAEIVCGGKALVATPMGFSAVMLPRSTERPFYSHQRKIPVERWTVGGVERPVELTTVVGPSLLPRAVPYPSFSVASSARRKTDAGYFYDFPFVDTGFLGVRICCKRPVKVTLRFEEALTDGRLNLHRNGNPATSWHAMHNFVTWNIVKPGVYDLESIEPYSLKHVEVRIEGPCGRILSPPWIRQYRNPYLEQVSLISSDPEMDAIFAAACNSLAMNAVDLYTDCPSRERSAWLCDSHFTAMAAAWLTGDNSIEGSQLENFVRTTNYPGLPVGSMSGLYPGNQLVPTYMMWYVLQCAEHVQRAGSDAERFKAAVRERVLGNVAYLRQYENADGLLENLPGWIFVEWSKANDFTAGVNYPVNALWSAALESAGRLYACQELIEKAGSIRESIRTQAFDGTYFRDHAVRDAAGGLMVQSDKTETCQYYQFFFGVASQESYPSLWGRLTTEFGPGKTADGLHPSDMFFGQLLRLELLGRFGQPSQELAEIKHYFGTMAKTSGALWEFADGHDSRCHGFGSFVAVLLLRDVIGLKSIDHNEKRVSVKSSGLAIDRAKATVRTSDGPMTVCVSMSEGHTTCDAELPKGWVLSRGGK